MKRLLKVLKKDLTSPYQSFKYEIGKEYHCSNFDNSPDLECAPGFYATDWDGLSYAYRKGLHVYEVEVWGKEVECSPFKRRYEHQKIVRKLSQKEIRDGLKRASKEAGYDLYRVSFPKNPLTGKPKNLTKKLINTLKSWESVKVSVKASIKASVGTAVWASVWDSVGASVWASVWDSVGASVWASVWAYISSFFPNINRWKHIQHKEGENPFQSCIDLWNAGFVPSFDGTTWRLHSGKNADIVYEMEAEE